MVLIDYEFALNQLSDNKSLLHKMLLKFSSEFASKPKAVRDMVAQDDLEQAKLNVHTAKGIAGNLGLKQLYQVATKLDAELKDTKPSDQLLDEYERCLIDTAGKILEITQDAGDMHRDLVAPTQSEKNSKADLLNKLSRNEFIDDKQLIDLVSGLALSEAESQQLIQLVEELQYPQAIDLINQR